MPMAGLVWLVVHITFMTGFKNRFTALIRWFLCFVGRARWNEQSLLTSTNCSLTTQDSMVVV